MSLYQHSFCIVLWGLCFRILTGIKSSSEQVHWRLWYQTSDQKSLKSLKRSCKTVPQSWWIGWKRTSEAVLNGCLLKSIMTALWCKSHSARSKVRSIVSFDVKIVVFCFTVAWGMAAIEAVKEEVIIVSTGWYNGWIMITKW